MWIGCHSTDEKPSVTAGAARRGLRTKRSVIENAGQNADFGDALLDTPFSMVSCRPAKAEDLNVRR